MVVRACVHMLLWACGMSITFTVCEAGQHGPWPLKRSDTCAEGLVQYCFLLFEFTQTPVAAAAGDIDAICGLVLQLHVGGSWLWPSLVRPALVYSRVDSNCLSPMGLVLAI